jgi:hypothetical protein
MSAWPRNSDPPAGFQAPCEIGSAPEPASGLTSARCCVPRGIPGTPWTPQSVTFGNGVPTIRVGRLRVVFVRAGHVPPVVSRRVRLPDFTRPRVPFPCRGGSQTRPPGRCDGARQCHRHAHGHQPRACHWWVAGGMYAARHAGRSWGGHAAACPYERSCRPSVCVRGAPPNSPQ